MNVFETLAYYFSFPFIRYAFIVGVLVSLCSSLLGVTLVLKRYSFIGDGLSHVAFGAIAIASVLGITNNMIVVLPVTVASAVLLLFVGQRARIRGDAALAMLSVGALAVGYLLMNVFSVRSNISGDVCTALFGAASILTPDLTDLWISVILAVLVVAAFVVLYHRIFSVTFDESFARATGIRTGLYNLLIAIVIAVIIVIGMKLVGSLLVSALVIFPALSAMRVFRSFRSVTIASAIIAVAASSLGILASILFETPAGATIVAADILAFACFTLAGAILRRKKHA